MSGAASSSAFESPAEPGNVADVCVAAQQQASGVLRVARAAAATGPPDPAEPEQFGKEVKHGEGLYNQHLLLTYAQCEVPPSLALAILGHSKIVTGLAICQETHQDGGHHLHVFLQKKRTVLPWEAVLLQGQTRCHRPNVRSLTTAKHRYNAFRYLHKEGVVTYAKSFSEPPAPRSAAGRMSTSQDLLDVASTSSIETALSQYVQEGGDLARVGPVQRGLQVMLAGPPPGPRWEATCPQIELRPWQTLLLGFLNARPERRRVFWVFGEPGSGKTTFSSWLDEPSNYEGGVLNMGACFSTTNALHNYHQQAVVCFDYPLSFRWDLYADDVSQCCETFSEFGSSRQSTKYVGRRVRICCHVVVFSNIRPIEQVRHRDVVLIETASSSQCSTLSMGPALLVRGSDEARSRSRSPMR